VLTSTSADEACKGVDIAVMVGGFPRKAGMERKDVMSKNVSIYAAQVRCRGSGGMHTCVLWVHPPGATGALCANPHTGLPSLLPTPALSSDCCDCCAVPPPSHPTHPTHPGPGGGAGEARKQGRQGGLCVCAAKGGAGDVVFCEGV
jgi:hypothetical protein